MRIRECDLCGKHGNGEGWIEIRYLSPIYEPREFDVCSPNCGRGLVDQLEELRALEAAQKRTR